MLFIIYNCKYPLMFLIIMYRFLVNQFIEYYFILQLGMRKEVDGDHY